MKNLVVSALISPIDCYVCIRITRRRYKNLCKYEYMLAYIESAKEVGRLENAYHSHPGYGCWLSGIDVLIQNLNQEPFVAIVVDPMRTVSAGKICLGAFRTYPKGDKLPNEVPSELQTITLNEIEDFGVHCKKHYPLKVSYFESALDKKLLHSLWNKYWVNTLEISGLLSNTDYNIGQIFDLSEKLEQSGASLGRGLFVVSGDINEKKKLSNANYSIATIELIHGLMAQICKDKLFNTVRRSKINLIL